MAEILAATAIAFELACNEIISNLEFSMRKIAFMSTVAIAAVASPAFANEARLELHGGSAWVSGASTEVIGLTAGYDADVGSNFFMGVEAVADTDFEFSGSVLGLNARLGAKVGKGVKLFGVGGWAHDTNGLGYSSGVLGAGTEFSVGEKISINVQYQRFTNGGLNRITTGLGFKF